MIEEKKILETALLCAQVPLSIQDMKKLLENKDSEIDGPETHRIRQLLAELEDDWADKGLELVQVADGWRFQSRPEMKPWLDRLTREKQPRYSRSTLEILAIIAYNQPVTRGDIERVRGVMINPNAIRMLEERGWIETVGYRETPGRPALFATTSKFLSDLRLTSLEQLPPLLQSMEEADLNENNGINKEPVPKEEMPSATKN